MSALAEWVKQVDWAAVGEVLGVAALGFLSALGGARAAAKRLSALLRKALGPELTAALVADVAASLKPAVLRAQRAAVTADLEARQAETDKALVSAVRATVSENMADLREQMPGMVREVIREELRALSERVESLDRRLAYVEGKLGVAAPAK
jgi:hypothetical protein